MPKPCIMDSSESSEVTYSTATSTLPPSEILPLSTGKHSSEKDLDYRRKNAYKWYKLFAKPTRETMCCIIEYTEGPDFTDQDVDLLPWNFEETEVIEEAMKSPKKFAAVRMLEEDGVNLYSEEYQRKKEIEKREMLEVQKLDESMTDVFRYQSPTRNTKIFQSPAIIGKINSPGLFNFETSDVAASPVRRPFARRHSLITAKDIEREKIANDDFQANPLISPKKFHSATSVGSTSRPKFHRASSVQSFTGQQVSARPKFHSASSVQSFTGQQVSARPKFHRASSVQSFTRQQVSARPNFERASSAQSFTGQQVSARPKFERATSVQSLTGQQVSARPKFYRATSVRSTSNPGLPSLSICDNDDSTTNSEQAHVKEMDYAYGISHSRYSVTEEDDDESSFYELDEDADDSEADQEPAPSDNFDAVRVPEEDVNLFSQEYQRSKKEIERREKLEVGILDETMTDVSRYLSAAKNERREKVDVQKLDDSMTDVFEYQSPTRNTKNFHGPAIIGKISSPGIFHFSPEEDPVESAKKIREKKVRMNSLRSCVIRGTSFNEDENGDGDDDKEADSTPTNDMWPGTIRERSFDEDDAKDTPDTKDFTPEEEAAKEKGIEVETAVNKAAQDPPGPKVFAPEEEAAEEKGIEVETAVNKDAQDKPEPEVFAPKEETAEEKGVEVETVVNEAVQEYAEVAIKAVQDHDGSDDDIESDDERKRGGCILEAKRFKAEAKRKKAEAKRMKAEAKRSNAEMKRKKEKDEKKIKKKRKEMEAQQRRLEGIPLEAEARKTTVEDVKEIFLGSSEDARRRQLAFSWYSQMSAPNRSVFKERAAALSPSNFTLNHVTPDDIDLLPWNATGSMVDIAKMNALARASILKAK